MGKATWISIVEEESHEMGVAGYGKGAGWLHQ